MDRKERENRKGSTGNRERRAANKRGWKQELRHLFIHVSIHETRLKDQNERGSKNCICIREKRRNNIGRKGRKQVFMEHKFQCIRNRFQNKESVLEQEIGC